MFLSRRFSAIGFAAACFAVSACSETNLFFSRNVAYTVDVAVAGRALKENALRASDLITISVKTDTEVTADERVLQAVFVDAQDRPIADPIVYNEPKARSLEPAEPNARTVNSLQDKLESFVPPSGMAPGFYVLRIRISDEIGEIHESRFECYYLGDADLSLAQTLSYPPGPYPSKDKPLFPTGINFLLQAAVRADPRLDPYINWSFGGKPIGGGLVSKGGAALLWLPPAAGGFHRLTAQLYPCAPTAAGKLPPIADTASLKIATSPDAPYPALPAPFADYLAVYRFLGDLSDAKRTGASGLRQDGDFRAVWLPTIDSYGLAVGSGRSYSHDAFALPLKDGRPEACRLTLWAVLTAPAVIFTASFPTTAGTVDLELAYDGVAAVLRIAAVGAAEETLKLPFPVSTEPKAFRIDLDTAADAERSVLIRFAVGGYESETLTMDAAADWTGAGRFRLGSPATLTAMDTAADPTTDTAIDLTTDTAADAATGTAADTATNTTADAASADKAKDGASETAPLGYQAIIEDFTLQTMARGFLRPIVTAPTAMATAAVGSAVSASR